MLSILKRPHALLNSQELYVSPRDKIFFPNLNGLRFLAALLVIVSHMNNGMAWATVGQLGVTLFFVLSGFLITYLLLAEKEKFGKIRFKDFYLRRALRIWPLYYFVVIISLFVLPHINLFHSSLEQVQDDIGLKSILYFLMLPNAAKELFPTIPYLGQAWSIGVEEQFYLFWPLVIQYTRRYFLIIAIIASVFTVFLQSLWFSSAPGRELIDNTPFVIFAKNFMSFLRIQCMCIGGIFALMLYYRWHKVLTLLMSKPMQVIIWFTTVVLVIRGQAIWHITHEFYSILFGIIILNLAGAKKSLVKLQLPWLDYLGRISYGLYMLHLIALALATQVVNYLLPDSTSIVHQVAMYTVGIGMAIVLASISYHYLERPFLKYKKLFVHVKSGN